MSAFLYYVSGNYPQMTLAKVAELGLAYAFERKPDARETMHGPDGGCGPVFGIFEKLGDELTGGYFPDKQTWRKIPKSEAWIGYYNDAKPGPEDLMREQALEGHWVELADGNKWLAPIARSIDAEADEYSMRIKLPVQSGLDDDGNWTPVKVTDRYAGVWDLATDFWDHVTEALSVLAKTDPPPPPPGIIKFRFVEIHTGAIIALRTNYLISDVEADVLGLLTFQHSDEILRALIDWPTVSQWIKKKMQ